MELGWCDVCLRVSSAAASRAFYADLGFWRVEGNDVEGWAIVTNGDARLGLYEAPHMGKHAFTLNFRGGHVGQIAESLTGAGHTFESMPKSAAEGAGSATMLDPDGFVIFFDTAPGETKRIEELAEA